MWDLFKYRAFYQAGAAGSIGASLHGFRSVLRLSAPRRVWLAAQKHLPLGEFDVAASGERPTPRAPNHVDPNHDHWKQVSLDWAPARLFEPLADEDVPGDDVRPPAVTFTSGWNDIFCNETVDDYCAAAKASEDAKARGLPGNDLLYLFMGPWTRFELCHYVPAEHVHEGRVCSLEPSGFAGDAGLLSQGTTFSQ